MSPLTAASSPSSSVESSASPTANRWGLAGVLLAGSVIGALLAHGIAPATAPATATVDPDLARLLQGMALVKLAFVAAMFALVVWRFGKPLSRPFATGYLFSVWTATAATVLIWQSAWLGLASVMFHAAGLAFMVIGLRDDCVLPSALRRSTSL